MPAHCMCAGRQAVQALHLQPPACALPASWQLPALLQGWREAPLLCTQPASLALPCPAPARPQVKFWTWSVVVSPAGAKQLSIQHVRTLKMADDVLCVKVSPDGKLLAVALLDATIKVGGAGHVTGLGRDHTLGPTPPCCCQCSC